MKLFSLFLILIASFGAQAGNYDRTTCAKKVAVNPGYRIHNPRICLAYSANDPQPLVIINDAIFQFDSKLDQYGRGKIHFMGFLKKDGDIDGFSAGVNYRVQMHQDAISIDMKSDAVFASGFGNAN